MSGKKLQLKNLTPSIHKIGGYNYATKANLTFDVKEAIKIILAKTYS